MPINFLSVVVFLFVGPMSYAQGSRNEFKEVPKGRQMDLLKEGNTLSISKEGSIQQVTPPSNMFATFLAGIFQPTSLAAVSSDHTLNYNFNHFMPIVTAQFSQFPWMKNGKWGWSGSLGYSYSQYQGPTTTALHIVPLELNAAYRMELKDTQTLIPYFMAGPSLWTYFQRGADAYNTSQSVLFGSVTAGVAFNLNRLHILISQNETEVVLQYQRTIGSSSGNMDFNGDSLQLGGTISL